MPALKLRALRNAILRGRGTGHLLVVLLVALVAWGEWVGVGRALTFLGAYGDIGLSVAQRSLEAALVVLSAGVAFGTVTVAISTLYLSDDLNFLLTQPIAAWRVFALKLSETFVSAAGVAALLTLPAALGLGAHSGAPAWYYPLAAMLTLLVYALPVGLGSALAVILMRIAPAGRVREIATGLGVLLSAGLVLFVRALKPEQLLRADLTPEAFGRLLAQFAGGGDTLLPPALMARALWNAAHGELSPALLPQLLLAGAVLWGAGALAALAYREGWVRGLEGSGGQLDRRPRGASLGERAFARLGTVGHLLYKDLRLMLRDATQWSQLLVLVALVGVYLVSLRAYPLEGLLSGARFKIVVGYLQLALQAFIVAGVGIRLAFPAVSLEGHGYWLLRSAPLSSARVVIGKYLGALPPVLLMALLMAWQTASFLQLSPLIATATLMVGVSGALVITALGVGIGAAYPRFRADNPAEIAVSAGGLMYMLLSLAYSAVLTALMARPAFISLVGQADGYFGSLEGRVLLGVYTLLTVAGTLLPLGWGIRGLSRWEG
nr:hypothetical protein [Deinobacterium chartae]